jgi:hypothetical protein
MDCPPFHPCQCDDKEGLMLFGGNHNKKDFHILTTSGLPHYKVKSYGAWAAEAWIERVTFKNFRNETTCGARQRVFGVNKYASDYIPMQKFNYAKFSNVTEDAFAYIMDPLPEWENIDDCIGFPCTAPSNVVLRFLNTMFEGQN